MTTTRRSFLATLGALIAVPAAAFRKAKEFEAVLGELPRTESLPPFYGWARCVSFEEEVFAGEHRTTYQLLFHRRSDSDFVRVVHAPGFSECEAWDWVYLAPDGRLDFGFTPHENRWKQDR